MSRHTPIVATAVLASLVLVGRAQPRQPAAQLLPVAETDGAHAGTSLRLALQVTLPDGLHVQSNRPRNASLIPTVLSLEPPPGASVDEIVYPSAVDLAQSGQAEPLSVYGEAFAIGVRLSVARGLSPHELVIPARLRYQACDATTCYFPARAQTEWRVAIVPDSVATPVRHQDVFRLIAFEKRP